MIEFLMGPSQVPNWVIICGLGLVAVLAGAFERISRMHASTAKDALAYWKETEDDRRDILMKEMQRLGQKADKI